VRFLADMGVSERVVKWLHERGHDARHLREEGLHRLPNGEIFRKAFAEKRVILTFDLDFGEIAALSRGELCGVVLFRLRNTRSANVCARLGAVLEASSHHLERGAIVSVEETRHRIRYLSGLQE
jgi:predicted nuclease of predicted toxin-antitoxin system